MATLSPRFDVQLMNDDMTRKGWTKLKFAKRARVSDMTVIRFLRGEQQTAPTAMKLARALGKSIDRYLITGEKKAS